MQLRIGIDIGAAGQDYINSANLSQLAGAI